MHDERLVTREQITAAQDPRSAATMPPEPGARPASELQKAIGDLGPAQRHLVRLMTDVMPVSDIVLHEIQVSIEACAARLTAMDAQEAARQPGAG